MNLDYFSFDQESMKKRKNLTVLVVDDEELVRWSLEQDLKQAGFQTLAAATGEDALTLIQENEPEIVLLDINLPGISGFDVLQQIQFHQYSCIVMMLSVNTEIDNAVKAVRAGAVDYITKPYEINDVVLRLEKNVKQLKLQREVSHLRDRHSQHSALDNLVAVSPKTQQIINTILEIAKLGESTVLIRGESGVGKDVFANAIHTVSPRANESFVEVNCPSFPAQLLENELFGHERGAYTDARTRKEGLVELADKGSLFINEIGDVDIRTQAKLLSFLEKKSFRRIGSTRERKVDVRVIAATNQNLERMVEKDEFRLDLFYRLNVIPIEVPPLRERKEDVPALIEHFLEQYRREFSKPHLEIDREVLQCLTAYRWPGNIRELKNCMERMVLLSKNDRVTMEVVPKEIAAPTAPSASTPPAQAPQAEQPQPNPSGVGSLVQQEIEMITKALEQAEWNQSRAARILKISRDTLRYRLKKYNIQIEK